jgi:uncharacterized ferritin-like protein (DUF455 family)
MELREFAEQVLFATTLEDKLQCPATVTDERPGRAIAAPEAPGRPATLHFKPPGSGRADFPGLHRLEQERERGRLLHFFANHELLATELMALVLLRFPEAPAAFRRGVLQTLKDEQRHTRLYVERMKACGLQFGELPVSGYFWRCVAPMENPIDYVAGLCLTFEQANLDFARHFANGFSGVGDHDTAQLLDRIYHDEIGHVAYGLKWFRRWKNPDESDWEAFCRHLKFPLSPQRAKGFTLNVEGRRAAGLDPDFIAQLNVYSQSKGRTPNVFVFNPFAEGRLAEGRAFTPVKHQMLLARDLANLPQFLGRQDDLVLVEKRPSVEFLGGLKQAGFALPEFIELNEPVPGPAADTSDPEGAATEKRAMQALATRKLGRLRPWAWGPDSVELLEPLFASVTGEARAANQRFNERIARLYSKAWSAEFLRNVLRSLESVSEAEHSGDAGSLQPALESRAERLSPSGQPAHRWVCTEDEAGIAVSTLDETIGAIAAIRARGHHRVVVKEAIGLAGHNAIRLWEPEMLETQRRWMANALARGRQLVVEPWLDRALDFSVQLEMTTEGLKVCGYTGLVNDRKGQYQANWAAPGHRRRIPSQVAALLRQPPDVDARLRQLYAHLFGLLEAELRRADYLGPVGIDALVYRTAAGDCRLKPVVEINPRYTMGRLTVELMEHTCPGSHGLLRLVSRSMAQHEGASDFVGFARSFQERFPLRLEGEPIPKIREGALCLNDPAQAQVCLAVFQVSASPSAFPGGGAGAAAPR